MKKLRAKALLPLLFVACLASKAVQAQVPKKGCLADALALLKQRYPFGLIIYRKAKQPPLFESWLQCDRPDYALHTAVHESLHTLNALRSTSTEFTYFLGPRLTVKLRNKNLFSRQEIRNDLPPVAVQLEEFHNAYLVPGSFRNDFTALLEELAAYIISLRVDMKLVDLKRDRQNSRDGVAMMLLYTELYLKRARIKHHKDWLAIAHDPSYVLAIGQMWKRAEATLAKACGHPKLGMIDRALLREVYAPKNLSEVSRLKFNLQDRPRLSIPRACLSVKDASAALLARSTVHRARVWVTHLRYKYAPGQVMNLVITPYSVTHNGKVLSEAELQRLPIYHDIRQSQNHLKAKQ